MRAPASYLWTSWLLEHDEEDRAKKADALQGWTASSLAEKFMIRQVDDYYKTSNHDIETPSLLSIAVGRLLEVLQSSEDVLTDARTIAETLSSVTLRKVLEDARINYSVLRLCLTLPQTLVADKRRIVDVDEAVLRNERYIRSRGLRNQDGKYLVSLEPLCNTLMESKSQNKPTKASKGAVSEHFIFTRKDPPKGGLEVLDYWRSRELKFNTNDNVFSQVFDRITNGILRGLDWSHVMVAGGMALTTLLHVDPARDNQPSVRDPDIDLYVYDLSPADANRKAEEIYDVWVRNLPPSTASEQLVVKNAKTITLLTKYPNRRIQIILKLPSSPTDVLLNFDLDACAIGFNGSEVFMLPRCARAIETGYSIFTMDLVWGHHLGDRRASQDSRIFKYADRGFGIRFLPTYARSLEEDTLEDKFKSPYPAKHPDESTEHIRWLQRNRKPAGDEPGLKTLERIAYMGWDYPHRYYFGTTPLNIPLNASDDSLMIGTKATDPESDREWHAAFDADVVSTRCLFQTNKERRANGQPCTGPSMALSELDAHNSHCGLPDGRRGLANFEIFMRHCEAWRLHACADATLDMDSTATLAYDPASYDDIPAYTWDQNFDIDDFEYAIEQANNDIWSHLKHAICGKLRIPTRTSGFAHYSTRRVRRQVCGRDFATVQQKQITIPIIVPWELQEYLLSTIGQEYDDLPHHFTDFSLLTPVHNPASYATHMRAPNSIPSLRDAAGEKGNLRFWVITNESMWSNQHRVLDETAELMWVLFHWLTQNTSKMIGNPLPGSTWRGNTDESLFIWKLANAFRRRIVIPEVGDDHFNGKAVPMKSGLPFLRETLLFRRWALDSPRRPKNNNDEGTYGMHELFDEDSVRYPIPEDLFWNPEEEYDWDEEGVPEWIETPREKGPGAIRRVGIYHYVD